MLGQVLSDGIVISDLWPSFWPWMQNGCDWWNGDSQTPCYIWFLFCSRRLDVWCQHRHCYCLHGKFSNGYHLKNRQVLTVDFSANITFTTATKQEICTKSSQLLNKPSFSVCSVISFLLIVWVLFGKLTRIMTMLNLIFFLSIIVCDMPFKLWSNFNKVKKSKVWSLCVFKYENQACLFIRTSERYRQAERKTSTNTDNPNI